MVHVLIVFWCPFSLLFTIIVADNNWHQLDDAMSLHQEDSRWKGEKMIFSTSDSFYTNQHLSNNDRLQNVDLGSIFNGLNAKKEALEGSTLGTH